MTGSDVYGLNDAAEESIRAQWAFLGGPSSCFTAITPKPSVPYHESHLCDLVVEAVRKGIDAPFYLRFLSLPWSLVSLTSTTVPRGQSFILLEYFNKSRSMILIILGNVLVLRKPSSYSVPSQVTIFYAMMAQLQLACIGKMYTHTSFVLFEL